MSRIGRAPITIPAGVDVKLDDSVITVKGPKGTLTKAINPEIKVDIQDGVIHVTRPSDDRTHRSLHGLTRTLISNMVRWNAGVHKELEVTAGAQVQKQASRLL